MRFGFLGIGGICMLLGTFGFWKWLADTTGILKLNELINERQS